MTFQHRYSKVDQFLHTLAFRNIGLQKMLADMEDQVYRKRVSETPVVAPVFITSLPRAGTTLMLETLSALPQFAAHTYRQMPFVLCPLLWNTLSQRFHRSGGVQERAHGDGMTIGFDSAEAFEEVLWKAFWPGKYHADRIEPWTGEEINDEFDEFFVNHIKKIVLLRADEPRTSVRYVSKNNANVARIETLTRLFPDCVIVLMFRSPLQHAMSLHRQHKNFLQKHAEDPFIRQYMEQIGHLEFGDLLRPFDFDGWLDRDCRDTAEQIGFWVAYWVNCFRHVIARRNDAVKLIDYDRCCTEPGAAMHALAAALDINDPGLLLEQASRYRAPRIHDPAGLDIDPALAAEAAKIHDELKSAAVF